MLNLGNPGSVQPSSSSGSSVRWIPYDRLVIGADGQPCVTSGYYREGEAPTDVAPEQVPNPNNVQGAGGWNNIYETYPPCPGGPPAPPDGGAPAETPARVAARYWEEVPLPRPQPYIAPGRAITGKLAYLETRGETRHVYGNSTILGPLEIVATGTYWVDWGDGQTTGPHNVEGRPWPEGQITHDYTWVGAYDVVVTERWTATWRLGANSGNLRELRTTGRIDDFPVQEIQAVVVRR